MIDLIATIDHFARRCPDRHAHRCRDHSLGYGALAARSDALASWLVEHVPRGQPVAVYGHKEPELLVCFLACTKAGLPYVPIDRSLPPDRTLRIVRGAGASLVLAPDGLHGQPAPDHARLVAGDELAALIEPRLGAAADRAARVRGAEVVYIIFTSGSTGEPKGVPITLDNLAGFVAWARQIHPVSGGRRFLNQAPFSFDLSVMDLYLALSTGGTLCSVDRAMIDNPLELREALAALDLEVWVSTPSFAELCLRDRRFAAGQLPRLDTFLFCGETLAPDCVRALHARFPGARVYNLYGPTEATVAVTSVLVDDAMLARREALPLGTPRPDTRLIVVHDGHEAGPGEPGEIVIEGPSVSPGYWREPELTERVFAGEAPRRRYRTGDAGVWRDGELYFGGRLDHQIKLDGHRIELDDVAGNLARLPGVEAAAVVPVVRGGRCEALVGFVVLTPASAATPAGLRGELARLVPRYMVPRELRCVAALPMTPNGKLDRAQLAAAAGLPHDERPR